MRLLCELEAEASNSVPSRTGSSGDLSSFPDPLVADPLDAQGGGTCSMQGLLRSPTLQVQGVPEHRSSLPRSGGHPEVGEGCEAAN